MSRSLADTIERAGAIVAGATLGAALLSIFAQIFARFVLNSSIVWSEEFARYALVWSVMIGAAVAYRRGEHIAVTSLAERLPSVGLKTLSVFVHSIVAAFSVLLLYQSAMLTLRTFARNQLSIAMQIDMGWIYLALPFGSALLALAALEAIFSGREINVDLQGDGTVE